MRIPLTHALFHRLLVRGLALVVVAGVGLVGCGKDDIEVAEDMVERMCACEDRECLDDLEQTFKRKLSRAAVEKLRKDNGERMTQLMAKLAKCQERTRQVVLAHEAETAKASEKAEAVLKKTEAAVPPDAGSTTDTAEEVAKVEGASGKEAKAAEETESAAGKAAKGKGAKGASAKGKGGKRKDGKKKRWRRKKRSRR